MSTMYIGTYTHTGSKGIYRVELCGGKLCMKDAVACENPSYLLLDQAHSKLIAVVENTAYRSMHGGRKSSMCIMQRSRRLWPAAHCFPRPGRALVFGKRIVQRGIRLQRIRK